MTGHKDSGETVQHGSCQIAYSAALCQCRRVEGFGERRGEGSLQEGSRDYRWGMPAVIGSGRCPPFFPYPVGSLDGAGRGTSPPATALRGDEHADQAVEPVLHEKSDDGRVKVPVAGRDGFAPLAGHVEFTLPSSSQLHGERESSPHAMSPTATAARAHHSRYYHV